MSRLPANIGRIVAEARYRRPRLPPEIKWGGLFLIPLLVWAGFVIGSRL